MATGTLYQSVDMSHPTVFYGTTTIATSSQIQVSDGANLMNYYGTFYYNYYGLAGGTVNSADYSLYGTKYYSVSGLSAPALTVYNYLNNGDAVGLLTYILSGNDSIFGSAFDDTVIGVSGNDILYGNSGEDIIAGGVGDDTLIGGAGNDLIFGGSSTDTVQYNYNYSQYSIVPEAAGWLIIYGPEGIDFVRETEYLKFADGTYSASAFTTLTVNGGVYAYAVNGIDMRDTSTWIGQYTYADSTLRILTDGVHAQADFGSFFYNSSGYLTGGVIQSIAHAEYGIPSYTVTGMNLDLSVYNSYISRNDVKGLARYTLSGNDSLVGSATADFIEGFAGNDTIDGGGGTDTVLFEATFATSTINRNPNGTITVSSSTDGTDSLRNVEYAQFADRTVSLLNSPPVITSSAIASTPENVSTSAAIYTVTGTDTDVGTILTYLISGGLDANLFSINSSTGAVTFKVSPNFEAPADAGSNNVYDITVRVSDGLLYADRNVAITVTDVSEGSSLGKDFNADRKSDILLQNVKDGSCYIWELNGTSSLVGNGYVGWTPGKAWEARGTGDFNGDGKSDILLQNANDGTCYIWELNGTGPLVGNGYVGWTPGAAWQAKGTGDFNGDGKSDVLLQNVNDGSCYIWELNGAGALVGNGYVGWTPGKAWEAKGTGDFNGDGKSDILLQNANDGTCYIWELNGTGPLVGNGYVGWTPGAAWQAKGTGDFNGDGKSDVLLQNANDGSCYIWELNGAGPLVGNGYVGWTPGKAWEAKGTGDFNGDGKSDILLQNANDGTCYIWELNGTGPLVGNGYVGWTPGADWHAVA